MMIVSLIAAMDRNRGIGLENTIPWARKLPTDMKRFKILTTGHTVVMGRLTYLSIGKPLPNRRNIILSRDPEFRVPGIHTGAQVEVCSTLETAFDLCRDESEVFVIGGAQIYAQSMDTAGRLYLTLIHGDFKADVFFPKWTKADWITAEDVFMHSGGGNEYSCQFFTLHRKPPL